MLRHLSFLLKIKIKQLYSTFLSLSPSLSHSLTLSLSLSLSLSISLSLSLSLPLSHSLTPSFSLSFSLSLSSSFSLFLSLFLSFLSLSLSFSYYINIVIFKGQNYKKISRTVPFCTGLKIFTIANTYSPVLNRNEGILQHLWSML